MENYRLLQAARGEVLDHPPVWMMRQAGRYMKVYRDLRQKYPSFRERSENPDLAVEISLQPFHAFKPDGVIMFSDILTPLPGIGIPFDIIESKGPVFEQPIRTQAQIDALTPLDPAASLPFVRQILTTLCQEVDGQATVLGFVGAPWTLGAYAIEGKSSKDYAIIKSMAFSQPAMLYQFLEKLAMAIAVYVRYQIDAGAQVVQLFDSWAGQLSPEDFETFALPYQQRVVEQVKATHPDTPLILYVNNSAGVLELMAQSGVDIVSVDWTVDMAVARQRLGANIGVQGNIDPCVLFGPKDFIRDRILDTVRKAGNQGQYDALILAVAGLQRLGMGDRIHQVLPTELSLYAVGQGALGIECRALDTEVLSLLKAIEHVPTRDRVLAERAFLRELEGGCQVPIGVHTQLDEDMLTLTGLVASFDGKRLVKDSVTGCASEAEHLGIQLAQTLRQEGAQEILDEIFKAVQQS